MTKSIPTLAAALSDDRDRNARVRASRDPGAPGAFRLLSPRCPTCSAAGRPIDRSINPMPITSMPCRCVISARSRRDIIARRDKEPGLVPVA